MSIHWEPDAPPPHTHTVAPSPSHSLWANIDPEEPQGGLTFPQPLPSDPLETPAFSRPLRVRPHLAAQSPQAPG